MHLDLHRALRCRAKSTQSACRAARRRFGARGLSDGRSRRRRSEGQQERREAWRDGCELIALRWEVQALARMARKTIAAIG